MYFRGNCVPLELKDDKEMKVAYSSKQLTFEEMKGSLSCLPKDNQWVKLGDSLPWDEFDKLYLSKLRNDGRGAKNLPSRMISARSSSSTRNVFPT